MISDYYDKTALIRVLEEYIIETERSRVDWERVISDGEVYPYPVQGVDGCFIYQIDAPSGSIVVFVHPMVCTDLYFDHVGTKQEYMNGECMVL